MKKTIILTLLLFSFLEAKNCDCSNTMTIIFENNHEKVFEIRNTIYKLIKHRSSDSVLMLLDKKLHKYITISSDLHSNEDNDEDVLELMQ